MAIMQRETIAVARGRACYVSGGMFALLRKPDLSPQQHKSQESLMASGRRQEVYRARAV